MIKAKFHKGDFYILRDGVMNDEPINEPGDGLEFYYHTLNDVRTTLNMLEGVSPLEEVEKEMETAINSLALLKYKLEQVKIGLFRLEEIE
jgi:hypothetical protein